MRSKLKIRFWLVMLLACIGLLVYGLSIRILPSVDWLSVVILASAVILNLTIRCPNCGKRLTGRNTWGIPHYCPNCGKAISDAEMEE